MKAETMNRVAGVVLLVEEEAREHYGEVNLSKYRRTLVDALRTVVKADRKDEELLELIDELEEGCGVGAEKVKRKAQEALDISENEFEDIFRELREQGRVYEPVLGKVGTTGVE